MGNKVFESKLHNASHDYVDGTHYTKRNDALSPENVKEYNKMKFTKDPSGILPDDSYEAGKNKR